MLQDKTAKRYFEGKYVKLHEAARATPYTDPLLQKYYGIGTGQIAREPTFTCEAVLAMQENFNSGLEIKGVLSNNLSFDNQFLPNLLPEI